MGRVVGCAWTLNEARAYDLDGMGRVVGQGHTRFCRAHALEGMGRVVYCSRESAL